MRGSEKQDAPEEKLTMMQLGLQLTYEELWNWIAPWRCPEQRQGGQVFVTIHWCWMWAIPGEPEELWMRAVLEKGLRCESSAASTLGS